METEYYLRISEKHTNKIIFTRWIYSDNYREAILQATKRIVEDTELKTKLSSKIDINLISREHGKVVHRKMKWNDNALTDGTGYFSDWIYHQNKDLQKDIEKIKARSFRVTRFTVKFFALVFFISFFTSLCLLLISPDTMQPDELNKSKIIIGFLNVLLGIVFTGISPILRENFNRNAKNEKDIYVHNLKLEFPSWLAATSTIIYFFNEDVARELIFLQIAVIVVAVAFLILKITFEYHSDIEKFYSREYVNLFKSQGEQ